MLQIRKMTECDLRQVAAIAASVFAQPWSRQGFAEALPMENTCFLLAENDGIVCGYCGMYMAADEGEIINVAVRRDCQRQGIADCLLLALLQEGRQNGIGRFFLEVRVSNAAAIHLYKKHGFVIQGIRKNFYEDNHEDAYVMNCLTGEAV
ncbi:MAG: ribosomal protein S18-alanine N-acetyltransferase [Eubacterium sp.]|jgi:ribosomal-protein-alanine N-acetyltransferase|nr:ribosomal protein S18-alanine N-acetyltransferase [Eubacterium sp.]